MYFDNNRIICIITMFCRLLQINCSFCLVLILMFWVQTTVCIQTIMNSSFFGILLNEAVIFAIKKVLKDKWVRIQSLSLLTLIDVAECALRQFRLTAVARKQVRCARVRPPFWFNSWYCRQRDLVNRIFCIIKRVRPVAHRF